MMGPLESAPQVGRPVLGSVPLGGCVGNVVEISVAAGQGYGSTPLSAFDAALRHAGVHNYNLIMLSSVIPPGAVVRVQRPCAPARDYGHRLYVVKADIRSRAAGRFIGAALGWYQLPDGRGVFVEHEEIGETKLAVESSLAAEVRRSLSDLCRARDFPLSEEQMKLEMSIAQVDGCAACALALAVYRAEQW